MAVLTVLFVLLLILMLLAGPFILEARVRLSLRGAVVRAKLFVFGLIPIPVKLTVRLFSEPYFSLCIGSRTIPLLKRKRIGGEIGLLKGVRLIRLDSTVTAGIEDDPARAVLASGSLAVLLNLLTARIAESGRADARLSSRSAIRLSFRLCALLYPPEMLCGFVRARRIARRKAANNSRKTSEKRRNHASC